MGCGLLVQGLGGSVLPLQLKTLCVLDQITPLNLSGFLCKRGPWFCEDSSGWPIVVQYSAVLKRHFMETLAKAWGQRAGGGQSLWVLTWGGPCQNGCSSVLPSFPPPPLATHPSPGLGLGGTLASLERQ